MVTLPDVFSLRFDTEKMHRFYAEKSVHHLRKRICAKAVYIDVNALGERHFRVQKVDSSGIVDLESRCAIPLQSGYLYCEERVRITSKAGKKAFPGPTGWFCSPQNTTRFGVRRTGRGGKCGTIKAKKREPP